MLLNKRCVELVEMFYNDGFECCILKGQGNALMYPNPYSRTPGDIDILVRPKTDERGKKYDVRKVVTEYVRKKFPETRIRYQHIDYLVFPDVEVEVHFIPTAKNNPIYNKRTQKWADEWLNKKADGGCLMANLPDGQGKIPVPSVEFNVIYQMSHLMHHFFDEGIGLRQFVDYYYLLKSVHGERLMVLSDVGETLKHLNLYCFAGAVMYFMKEVLGLEDKYLILPVDERRGKTLLKEILQGGNFGHYSGLDQKNALTKYFQKTWRNMKLVREYPAEALCEPVFRTWHFFWRLRH